MRPSATWRNDGNVEADFDVWLMLTDPAGGSSFDAEVYSVGTTTTAARPTSGSRVRGIGVSST